MYTEEEATKIYLRPPTIEQIFSFVHEVGVPYVHFEDYYGMHKGVLKNVKCGNKPMPRKYWWIFYERIVPQYGAMFGFKKPPKKNPEKIVSRRVSPKGSHNRLGNIVK